MVKTNLRDDHHIVRFVKSVDLRRDDQGVVIGVNPSAFKLREAERYLSASHLEGAHAVKLSALQRLYGYFSAKFSNIKKAAFTVGSVGGVKDACAKKGRVKVANEPKTWNPNYAAVRQFPDDLEIREKLAAERWADWVCQEFRVGAG